MKNIGVEVAPEHAFGRRFLEGVAAYAVTKSDWRLCSIPLDNMSATTIAQLDGLILRLFGNQIENAARRTNVPVVDVYGERPRCGLAQIHGDYDALGRIAAEFFLARSFTNFGWCGIDGLVFSDETRRHFFSHLAAHGRQVAAYTCAPRLFEKISYTAPDKIPDAKSLRKWLRSLPTPIAIFCCNDHRAYQVMRVAIEAGLHVPRDVAILGVDNDTMICAYAQVPLSSIDPDAVKIGFSAARLLNTLINTSVHDKVHRKVLIRPKGIIERRSTEHIPIDPPWLSTVLLAIEKDLHDGISPSDVFRIAGKSAPIVERAFREKLGQSVISYITGKRMERAQMLLRTTNLLSKEIAALCGYSSAQYFCRSVRKHFGKSPRRLRGI